MSAARAWSTTASEYAVRVSSAGTAVSRTGSPGSSPQRRRSAAGIAMYARGGRVTRPAGSRRMTTTPASAVRVSRSPPRQPSALVTARSAIRPEASMRPIPYTTSSGADGDGHRAAQR